MLSLAFARVPNGGVRYRRDSKKDKSPTERFEEGQEPDPDEPDVCGGDRLTAGLHRVRTRVLPRAARPRALPRDHDEHRRMDDGTTALDLRRQDGGDLEGAQLWVALPVG
jgi:hypothetical protein